MKPEELRQIRLRYGLGQDELAAVLRVTKAAVSCWERGINRIPGWLEAHHTTILAAFDAARGVNAPGLYARRNGRPYSIERQEKEAAKKAAAEAEEAARPVKATVRFADPVTGGLYEPLEWRPYITERTTIDRRRKPTWRYEFMVPVDVYPAWPQFVRPALNWSNSAMADLADDLRRQLQEAGHDTEAHLAYMIERGARWSWHKIETSRPECVVTPARTPLP